MDPGASGVKILLLLMQVIFLIAEKLNYNLDLRQ